MFGSRTKLEDLRGSPFNLPETWTESTEWSDYVTTSEEMDDNNMSAFSPYNPTVNEVSRQNKDKNTDTPSVLG